MFQDIQHSFKYGYVTHTGQRGVYKLDLANMRYTRSIDLAPYNCVPVHIEFSALCKHFSSLSTRVKFAFLQLDSWSYPAPSRLLEHSTARCWSTTSPTQWSPSRASSRASPKCRPTAGSSSPSTGRNRVSHSSSSKLQVLQSKILKFSILESRKIF